MSQNENSIERIAGMAVTGKSGARAVILSADATLDEVRNLIFALRDASAQLSVYDAAYPSPSDPGAYFTYSCGKAAAGRWSMTLGNHGWTGGIYQVEDDTIAVQVFDLLKKGQLTELQFEGGCFFAHYDHESEERNLEMNRRIQSLHCAGKATRHSLRHMRAGTSWLRCNEE
jgi:hypothetical protein